MDVDGSLQAANSLVTHKEKRPKYASERTADLTNSVVANGQELGLFISKRH